MGEEGFHHIQGAVEVDVHHAFDGTILHLAHGYEILDDSCIVDEAVDGSEQVHGIGCSLLHCFPVCDVKQHELHVLAFLSGQLLCLLQAFQVDVQADDFCSFVE